MTELSTNAYNKSYSARRIMGFFRTFFCEYQT